MSRRPFRFAVQSFGAPSAAAWRERALRVEDLGYAALAAGLGRALGLSTEEMRRHPHGLFGTPDAICEELERRREVYGISAVTVGDDALEAFAPVVAKLAGR